MKIRKSIFAIALGVAFVYLLTPALLGALFFPKQNMEQQQAAAVRQALEKLKRITEEGQQQLRDLIPAISNLTEPSSKVTQHTSNNEALLKKFRHAADICNKWRIAYDNNPTSYNERHKIDTCNAMQDLLRN